MRIIGLVQALQGVLGLAIAGVGVYLLAGLAWVLVMVGAALMASAILDEVRR